MGTETTIQKVEYPSWIKENQQQLLNSIFGVSGQPGLIDKATTVPQQQVQGFTQPQQDAFALAQQGIGGFQPYLQSALGQQFGAAGTAGQGNAGGSNGDGVYAIGGGGGGYSQAGIAGTQGSRDYTGHPFYAVTSNSKAYLNGGAFPDFGGLYNQDIVGTTINASGTGVPVNHGGVFFGQAGDDNTGQGGGGTRNGTGAAGGKGYALFVYSKNLTATVGGSLASTTDTVGNNKYTFVTNGTDTISWAVA